MQLRYISITWTDTELELEPDTEYPADNKTVETDRKIWFLHPLDHWKMQFPKPENIYHICTFLLFLCQPPKFCMISTQISTIILFSEKPEFL